MLPICIYQEEDLFPGRFANREDRPYGILFYNEVNRDSYDSNHALIYRDRVEDLDWVLSDIKQFYLEKGLKPIIYQSILDDGYFDEIRETLSAHGFDSWTEAQKYMLLKEPSKILPNPEIEVRQETVWREEFAAEIFEKAGEPWEIGVVKQALETPGTAFFVAYHRDKPVGMTHCHVAQGVCRVDYLLVNKESRGLGAGRALMHRFVQYCAENSFPLPFLWVTLDTAEKIYLEAGYRHVETKLAGRAGYVGP